MRIRILGAGWYGCHLALMMRERGHEVELREMRAGIFQGASGANPARLHVGFHYPRSRLTRAACQEHHTDFMGVYGAMTRHVPINLYAVAQDDSMVDFGTYRQVLHGEVDFITLESPADFGLRHVEGAIQTGERHIVINEARRFFTQALGDVLRLGCKPGDLQPENGNGFDWTIDCTFCANDAKYIDRFEPCVTALMRGPTEMAVTIMDGPFPSLYPWDEEQGLSSLTSAKWTPFSKTCRTYAEAKALLDDLREEAIMAQCRRMESQLHYYWPRSADLYRLVDYRLSIRAQPKSGADARLVDVQEVGERCLRVRAGKIDAILHAGKVIAEMIHA